MLSTRVYARKRKGDVAGAFSQTQGGYYIEEPRLLISLLSTSWFSCT